MTIMIYFYQMHYWDFKTYYTQFVQDYLRAEVPHLVSYSRFVELMPAVLVPLCAYLRSCYGDCTGISFIDSTPLAVCHNRRIHQHKVFDGLASRGKNSVDWCYGLKLHLVVNERGELIAMQLTPGNVDDRKLLLQLTDRLYGKLFGDKGYLSQPLRHELRDISIELITSIRRNMKPQLMPLYDKLMLKRRSIIETINDQLKNISQIEHSRHRSVNNFFVNLVTGLIAYCHRPHKPGIQLDPKKYRLLAALH